MEGLLHWDFNPGLAVADQVRRKFHSTVHPTPRSSSKEFFLVVSFSSASFPLSCSSVGLALQCCIGGTAANLNVIHILDRSYRFSVASNKVGHFIYGLRDRIWPDFICHFRLYKEHCSLPVSLRPGWHADNEIIGVSTRSSPAVKSDLRFLHDSALNDHSSAPELAKFGFHKSIRAISFNDEYVNTRDHSDIISSDVHKKPQLAGSSSSSTSVESPPSTNSVAGSCNLKFETVEVPMIPENQLYKLPCLMGYDHKLRDWKNLDPNILYDILDLWQANYCDADILQTLQITSVPTREFIHATLGRCDFCSAVGHSADKCAARLCATCNLFDRACTCTYMQTRPSTRRIFCTICNSQAHLFKDCPTRFKCSNCSFLGHTASVCGAASAQCFSWSVKNANRQVNDPLARLTVSPANGHRKERNLRRNIMVWRPKPMGVLGSDSAAHVNGITDPNLQFVSAAGADMLMAVDVTDDLLICLWNISWGKYTRRILGTDTEGTQPQFPLNPLTFFRQVYAAVATQLVTPIFLTISNSELGEAICKGLFIPSAVWDKFAVVLPTPSILVIDADASYSVTQVDTAKALAHSSNRVVPATPPEPNQLGTGSQTHVHISESSNETATVGSTSSHFGRMLRNEKGYVDTTQLRRSTRSTRYDGFRVPQPSDMKVHVSKVKNRVNPAITISSNATAPRSSDEQTVVTPVAVDIPPPTTIQTIQCIGTNLCGIPAEELSPKKLLASMHAGNSDAT